MKLLILSFMTKTKKRTIKAWAIINEDGEIKFVRMSKQEAKDIAWKILKDRIKPCKITY